MTDREKLIALLKGDLPYHSNEVSYWGDEHIGALADHLLANNVVVREWIPVTERLPELHTKVMCCGVKGGRFIAELSEWGNGILYWTKRDGKGCPTVTHWMPLPEPPKEGE